MIRIWISLMAAAAWLVTCQPARAQLLQTNTTTGDITLSNTTWKVAFTNISNGNVPLLTTFYNFGPGAVEYTWGTTNGSHVLPPGTPQEPRFVSFGPVTKIGATIYWRCASNNVTAVVRSVRDFVASWGTR